MLRVRDFLHIHHLKNLPTNPVLATNRKTDSIENSVDFIEDTQYTKLMVKGVDADELSRYNFDNLLVRFCRRGSGFVQGKKFENFNLSTERNCDYPEIVKKISNR